MQAFTEQLVYLQAFIDHVFFPKTYAEWVAVYNTTVFLILLVTVFLILLVTMSWASAAKKSDSDLAKVALDNLKSQPCATVKRLRLDIDKPENRLIYDSLMSDLVVKENCTIHMIRSVESVELTGFVSTCGEQSFHNPGHTVNVDVEYGYLATFEFIPAIKKDALMTMLSHFIEVHDKSK